MDPIHIDFTIPDQSLFFGFGLLVFAIVLYLAISKNWEWLQNRPSPLPWMAEHYVALLLPLGFIAISLAIYFWIWDIRGEIGRLVALLSDKAEPEAINNLAIAIGTLLAAVALAATIPFQLIKVWVNERLAKTTEQGHMTDRITKAVEQLGAEKTVWEDGEQKTVPNLEVRLGAIYALERIAQDSLRDHITVMEILCAYVRNNASAEDAVKFDIAYTEDNWSSKQWVLTMELKTPPIDIQATVTVIGRRKAARIKFERDAEGSTISHRYRLDLRDCNLQNMDMSGLNFSEAMFRDSMMQKANLHGTDLQKADLNWVKMQGANLNDAKMQGASLISSQLQETSFNGAKMQGANLKWAKMQGTNLRVTKMQGANLRGAKFDKETTLTAANLQLAAVKRIDFSEITTLSDDQAKSMFGDSTTKFSPDVQNPDWTDWSPDWNEFYKAWQAAKAAANL